MIKKLIWTALLGLSFASQALTLDEAIELARQNSPRLKAAQLKTQAAEKMLAASGRWKNPRIEFEAEGIGGDLNGVDDAEYTVGISQTFQRGGKQHRDRDIARSGIDVASQSQSEKELALLAEVRLAFIDVVSQQEIGTVRAEQEQLGRAFVQVTKTRYEAGGGSELDVVQAELALEDILLSQTCCFGDLEAARIRLASLIGVPEKEMGAVVHSYYELAMQSLQTVADSHPAVQKLNAQIAMAQAAASRAGAQDSGDVTLGVGMKYSAADEISTFVMSASIPLSFSKSGRADQVVELAKADVLLAEREELFRRFQQQLSMLVAQYNGSKLEAEMTRNRLMPKAKQAYELSQSGYEAGRFSWFELITAQHQLAAIRVREIEALRDAHVLRAEITKYMEEGI